MEGAHSGKWYSQEGGGFIDHWTKDNLTRDEMLVT